MTGGLEPRDAIAEALLAMQPCDHTGYDVCHLCVTDAALAALDLPALLAEARADGAREALAAVFDATGHPYTVAWLRARVDAANNQEPT